MSRGKIVAVVLLLGTFGLVVGAISEPLSTPAGSWARQAFRDVIQSFLSPAIASSRIDLLSPTPTATSSPTPTFTATPGPTPTSGFSLTVTPPPVDRRATSPGQMFIETGSGTWLTVHAPFSGDSDMDSYTSFEYGVSPLGPWLPACAPGIPGEPDWRQCVIPDLTPEAFYYVRTIFHDPDGVVGSNPQVSGAILMPADVATAVTVHTTTVTVEDTHLFVSVPISGDSDRDSLLQSVELAPSNQGPWVQRCGPVSSFAPKLCRIHGLTQGSEYWLRVTVNDPDGVDGFNPQILGPIPYTGLTNLAAGRPITADPGWGCCPDPVQLVDGRIQNPNWNYGFAWTGGLDEWGGGIPGWKSATIDLGSLQQVGRVDWWPHDSGSIPATWQVEISTDDMVYTPVFATSEFRCRTETGRLRVGWDFPACYHSARFRKVTARYVRYRFDDRTILDGLHGWSVELEVFANGGSWLYLPLIARNR